MIKSNDLWKISKDEVLKVNRDDLLRLTHFDDEIKVKRKIIKSIKFNKKINSADAKKTDKNILKEYNEKHKDNQIKKLDPSDSQKFKNKADTFKRIQELESEIKHIRVIGKEARKRFAREGYLTTFVDSVYTKKSHGMSPKEFKAKFSSTKQQAKSLQKPKVKYDRDFKTLNNLEVLGWKRIFYFKEATLIDKNNLAKFDQKQNYTINFNDKMSEVSFKAQIKSEQASIKKEMTKQNISLLKDELVDIQKLIEKEAKINDTKVKYNLFKRPNISADKAEIKKYLSQTKNDFRQQRDEKLITQKAYKEQVKVLRKKRKEKIRDAYANNEVYVMQTQIKSLKKAIAKRLKTERKLIVNEVDEVNKRIPSEVPTWHKWVFTPLAILIPGFSYLIRKQYKAALLFMALIPLLVFFVVYALGAFNVNGNGIMGLFDLGRHDELADARYYVIEGTIGIIFISIVGIYLMASVVTTWKTYKALEIGINPSTWSDVKRGLQANGYPYFMSIPALAVILLIVVTPIISTLFFSMTDYGPGAIPPALAVKYVGFDNYKLFFSDSSMWTSLQRVIVWTVVFTIIASVFSIAAGIALGMLTHNERLKGRKIFRVIFLLPTAIPGFITIGMIALMISPEGLISRWTGITTWKTELWNARIMIILIQIWVGYSGAYLMTIGVINAVPTDQKEAAEIDGIGRFKRTRHLVLPIITYQLMPLIIGTFLGTFNNFGIIYLVTNGGPSYAVQSFGSPGTTDTVISWVMKLTEGANPFHGISAAFLMITTLLIVPISAISLLRSKAVRRESL